MRPPDEVGRDLVQEWMAKGEEDFELARHLLSEGSSFLAALCFHAQQAAEKFLMAYLTRRRVEFPKTHDIDLAESLRECGVLSGYAVVAIPVASPS